MRRIDPEAMAVIARARRWQQSVEPQVRRAQTATSQDAETIAEARRWLGEAQRQQPVVSRGNNVGTSAGLSNQYTSPEAEARMLNRERQLTPPPPSPPYDPNLGPEGYDGPPPISSLRDPIPSVYRPEQVQLAREVGLELPRFQSGLEQLRLDLGEANTPMRAEDYRSLVQRPNRIDAQPQTMLGLQVPVNPHTGEVVYANPSINRPEWIEGTSGPVMVDSNMNVIFRPDPADPNTQVPLATPRESLLENLRAGLTTGYEYMTGQTPEHPGVYSRSIFGLANPQMRQEFGDQLSMARLNPVGKAAAILGAIGGDVVNFGTYGPLFWRSHPGDVLQSHVIPKATAEATGISDSYLNRPELKRYSIPLGVVTMLAMNAANGIMDPTQILNTEEGPRVKGFTALHQSDEDPRKTDNYGMALMESVLTGRSGRLLPFEQFTQERPDVSYERYKAYQDYLRGDGGVQLLGGIFKATDQNIDAPEDAWAIDPRNYEARIAGYRLTPVGVGLTAGALGVGMMGIRAMRRRGL